MKYRRSPLIPYIILLFSIIGAYFVYQYLKTRTSPIPQIQDTNQDNRVVQPSNKPEYKEYTDGKG